MVLKLASHRSLDRPMPGVMDSRSHLIRQQFAFAFKKLNRQHAHVIERFQHLAGRILGSLLDLRTDRWRRSQRKPQYPVAMVIFHQRVERRLPRFAAHRDHGQFAREADKLLRNTRLFGQTVFGGFHVLRRPQNPLPLPVVTHPPGLDHCRQPYLFDRRIDVVGDGHGSKFGSADSQLQEQLLFFEAVLRGLERPGRRKNGHLLGQMLHRIHRHVLKLVGHHVQPVCEFLERRSIRKVSRNSGGDASHGRFRRRVEKTESQSQRISRQGEHVPQLPAAEDPDAHARLLLLASFDNPLFSAAALDGSGLARTRWVWAPRKLRSASRMGGNLPPRIAAASSAALMAPALPIASVPTGMPAGICAIESSESSPFNAFDSTGTPSTGSTVFEAVIPGKCAAPPAPAIITSRPRFSALEAYAKRRSGVRCAETTRFSCGTPSSARVLATCSIVSQSEDDPMIMPTSGCPPELAPPGLAFFARFFAIGNQCAGKDRTRSQDAYSTVFFIARRPARDFSSSGAAARRGRAIPQPGEHLLERLGRARIRAPPRRPEQS